MQYKDLVEKMPTADFLYKDVTQEEIDAIDVPKFVLSDDTGFYVGTMTAVTKLKNKIFKSTGMTFE